MPKDGSMTEPLGLRSYAGFAERYASLAPEKPHNALYERPATWSLLGDVKGLRILDAGCGPGINSERLARQGASVHGFDVTPKMLELARERCHGLAAEFAPGDLGARLHWLRDGEFDKVLCALALDHVEDLTPTFAEFRRVARPRGMLVFSMSHPMRDWMDERTHGEGSYFDTTRFGMHWSSFGEPKPYIEAYRRPLEAILNALVTSGWRLDRILEPRPAPQMRDVSEALHAELSRSPAFLCVRALRNE